MALLIYFVLLVALTFVPFLNPRSSKIKIGELHDCPTFYNFLFFALVFVLIFGGLLYCGEARNDNEDEAPASKILYISSAVALLLIVYRFKRITKSALKEERYQSIFRQLQTSYEEVHQKAKNGDALTFSELPVFPFTTPYNSLQEQKHEPIQTSSNSDIDSLMDRYFGKIRRLMPDQLYMRGDKHNASADNSRVLLIIEEVAQAERELAVVAVVVQKRGEIVNVSIRRSGWPKTIQTDAPRSDSTKKAEIECSDEYDWFYYRYFAPIAWENARAAGTQNIVRAVFNNETNETAESIANAVYDQFREEFRKKY